MAKTNQELPAEGSIRNFCSRIGIYCVVVIGALILCVGLPLAAMRL